MEPQRINGLFNINAKLGGSVKEMYEDNPTMFIGSRDFDEKPTGSIGIRFDRPNLTYEEQNDTNLKVFSKNGEKLFDIQNVEDILIVSDYFHKIQGITAVDFNIQIRSQNRTIEDVYKVFKKVSESAKKNGWTPYIGFDMPRLKGNNTYEVNKMDGFTVYEDIYYLSSLKLFKKMYTNLNGSFFFVLKNKNNFMYVSMDNLHNYHFLITFKTMFSKLYYDYEEEEKTRAKEWRNWLKSDVIKWANERESAELKLKKLGYEIDESYENPDISHYLK